jgi:hypothetical protein
MVRCAVRLAPWRFATISLGARRSPSMQSVRGPLHVPYVPWLCHCGRSLHGTLRGPLGPVEVGDDVTGGEAFTVHAINTRTASRTLHALALSLWSIAPWYVARSAWPREGLRRCHWGRGVHGPCNQYADRFTYPTCLGFVIVVDRSMVRCAVRLAT